MENRLVNTYTSNNSIAHTIKEEAVIWQRDYGWPFGSETRGSTRMEIHAHRIHAYEIPRAWNRRATCSLLHIW